MKNLIKKRINNFEALNQNKYLLTNSFLIKQELTNALFRKDILVSNLNLANSNNNIVVTINGFTRTNKLLRYRKLLLKQKGNSQKNNNLSNLLTNGFNNTLKQNNVLINYINLNKILDKKILASNFKKYKKFNSLLFSRGLNLFLDFLKVITLVEQNKISPKVLLVILGQIFKKLTKGKHSRFIFFIKTIFSYLTKTKNKNILGLKFIMNGRIMGKPRANTVKIEKGSIELNTINSNCFSEKMHVYTVYGAFGFKIWINYKK